MKPLLLFITICFTQQVPAQFEEMKQPDSVFRVNHVKSRTVVFSSGKYKYQQVEMYDPAGHITKIELDQLPFGHGSTLFEYDNNGNMVKKSVLFFRLVDSIPDVKFFPDAPRNTRRDYIFEYDRSNKLSGEISISKEGKQFPEIRYSYDSFNSAKVSSERTLPFPGTVYTTTIFEQPGIPARSYGYAQGKDTTTKATFDYTYENKYDKQGRLIETSMHKTDPYSKAMDQYNTVMQLTYKYNKKGLLLKLIRKNFNFRRINEDSLVFEYEYW